MSLFYLNSEAAITLQTTEKRVREAGGAYTETQKGRGETEAKEAKIDKNKIFWCKPYESVPTGGGRGEGPSPPLPLYAYEEKLGGLN